MATKHEVKIFLCGRIFSFGKKLIFPQLGWMSSFAHSLSLCLKTISPLTLKQNNIYKVDSFSRPGI